MYTELSLFIIWQLCHANYQYFKTNKFLDIYIINNNLIYKVTLNVNVKRDKNIELGGFHLQK